MTFILNSFFINHNEIFIKFNPNILETNLINILILFGILIYTYKNSFSKTLEIRQQEIIQSIENAQNDVILASNYYLQAEKAYTQSLVFLQSWKNLHQIEKEDIINNTYQLIKKQINENFIITENLISNIENKTFLIIQRYFILIIAAKILRKFVSLSKSDQKRLIELTISKLENL
jgi:F0F1-type ATP synthase membrane subunit b/b'